MMMDLWPSELQGNATIPMPQFSVIYIKRTDKTPQTTTITFTFPNGQSVAYESENVILEQFTKEYIVEKRLFPYIPFYIARYERDIVSENDVGKAVADLNYFRDEMLRLNRKNELSDVELIDLKGFVNTIITHITNGNKNEERLVNIMGGTVIETESEKLVRQGIQQGIQLGQAKMLIEMGREDGLDEAAILKRIQEKIGLSLEEALDCMNLYGKQQA